MKDNEHSDSSKDLRLYLNSVIFVLQFEFHLIKQKDHELLKKHRLSAKESEMHTHY